MAVPDTNTFALSDVITELGLTLNSGVSLGDCFAAANASGFDATYEGSKDRLSNFRNYSHGEWSSISAPENNDWTSVATDGSGNWVAVAYSGTNRVMRSTNNGLTWSSVSVDSNIWLSVAYGNGVFVAVSSNGTNQIMRSTDSGATWTPVSNPTGEALTCVRYGGGVWVALSQTGIGNRGIRSTNNGVSWSTMASVGNSTWADVGYGNGNFVAVETDGGATARSSDGDTFSTITTNGGAYNGVDYGNGVWVIVADSSSYISRSINDASTFSVVGSLPETNSWRSVAYGYSSNWAVISNDGTSRVLYSTDNGSSWSTQLTPEQNDWQDIAYGNGVWIAVSRTGTNRIMRSVQ